MTQEKFASLVDLSKNYIDLLENQHEKPKTWHWVLLRLMGIIDATVAEPAMSKLPSGPRQMKKALDKKIQQRQTKTAMIRRKNAAERERKLLQAAQLEQSPKNVQKQKRDSKRNHVLL